MDKDAIKDWAERFVADLEVGGERVPLDRVIAAHLAELQTLRASGLTWRGIAAILARAGGRRANGQPISPDQLRADISRLAKRLAPERAVVPSPKKPSAAARPLQVPASPPSSRVQMRPHQIIANPSLASRSPLSPPDPPPHSGSKDVSDKDIAAALARLKTQL